MAASLQCFRVQKLFRKLSCSGILSRNFVERNGETVTKKLEEKGMKEAVDENQKENVKTMSFAAAFEKFSEVSKEEKVPVKEDESFVKLLRNSKLMQIGDPSGRVVEGTIFHIVGDDLYIDFGAKFHCVCPRPTHRRNEYVRGANVRLRLHSLELSSRFLGATSDITLLEADASVLGLISKQKLLLKSVLSDERLNNNENK